MNEKIGVGSLENKGVLYEGDLYDLACSLLKINDADDKGTNTISRHTVKGLIGKYALLTNIDHAQIMSAITKYALPLGATIEYDEVV